MVFAIWIWEGLLKRSVGRTKPEAERKHKAYATYIVNDRTKKLNK